MESIDPLCLLCGGRERKMLHRRRSWTVHRCASCDLGFLDHRPEGRS